MYVQTYKLHIYHNMLYVIYEYIYMYTYTNFMLTNRAQQNKIKFFIH